MEANQILITGGTMDITAADDGLNANGGEFFGSASTQCSFQVTLRGIAAGEEIVITDGEGTELMRHTALKACSSVVFSSPALTVGETYTVTAGGQTAQVTLNSVSSEERTTRWGW